ncbi:DUF475 domain-containing protein [Nocardioides speluncae]|uniref:DUF475 domain-containing protein n=1 Tax=Nocardioides speluncae TaxID=2670337 RepID=UPI000D68FFC3|nr:DUF475 domain-containing protein [Nocardioides speluncae]
MILRTFGWSFAITILGLIGAFFYGFSSKDSTGAALHAVAIATILIVLEVSLSFDNAVVNAKVLGKMSPFWQKMFLTVGILIAVFGMRLVFPFVVVWATAGLNPFDAWDLAMEGGDTHDEGSYAYLLHEAHPMIAAFGGMFLMMIFLDFFFDEEKDNHWLDPIERRMETLGRLEGAAVILSLGLLTLLAWWFDVDDLGSVLAAGILGLLTYLVVKGLGDLFAKSSGLEDDDEAEEGAANGSTGALVLATGKAAFFMFLYLEVLDASFSFDGVIGAFAITSDPIIIAIGLGVGAMYVRSVTVYLVRKGTLAEYVYLEHGAHWAIGALAVLLFVTMKYEIPELVTGGIGVAFILASLWWSIRENRLHPEEKHEIHI